MPLSAGQTEGGGSSGSGGSGSLCTNSMGNFNFLISIDKKVHIFINSLPIALNLYQNEVFNMVYEFETVKFKHLPIILTFYTDLYSN